MASHSPPESSQENPSQSNSSEERVWKLKDCEMKIGSCGKRDPKDQFMTIDLVFRFSDNPNSKVVGEYTNQCSPGYAVVRLDLTILS